MSCHGDDGRPVTPDTPDFSGGWQREIDEIRRVTREGVEHTAMPGFSSLTPRQLQAVSRYVHDRWIEADVPEVDEGVVDDICEKRTEVEAFFDEVCDE